MKFCYLPHNFNYATERLIGECNAVLENLTGQGYLPTLRQLYYQLVSKNIIANKQSEYKKLVDVCNKGRLAGLIDWDHLQDLTRDLRGLSHWDNPADIIAASAQSFRLDKWETQKTRVEVWGEKDALRNIVQRACNALDVPFFICRGYTSASEMYSAAQRLIGYIRNKQRPVIIHLGDHDPSGIDMTRDIQERLNLFGAAVDMRRIALNMDQIEQYNPPPNPAKVTDSRFAGYVEEYGEQSWELDALDPPTLSALIRKEVQAFIDPVAWNTIEDREHEGIETLRKTSRLWNEVQAFLNGDSE